jgi:hypothetical protein
MKTIRAAADGKNCLKSKKTVFHALPRLAKEYSRTGSRFRDGDSDNRGFGDTWKTSTRPAIIGGGGPVGERFAQRLSAQHSRQSFAYSVVPVTVMLAAR